MSQYLPEMLGGLAEDAAGAIDDIDGAAGDFYRQTAGNAVAAARGITGVDQQIGVKFGVIGDELGGGTGDLPGSAGDAGDLPGSPGDAGDLPGSPGGAGVPDVEPPGGSGVPPDGERGAPGPQGGSLPGQADGNPAAAARGEGSLPTAGDPVDVATGDVVLGQVDVRLPGVLPLVLQRAHRSSYRAGRWFGRSWASTLDERLEVTADRVYFAAGDGAVLCYPHPGGDGAPVWPVSGARWPMARDGAGYTISDHQAGTVRRFEPRPGYYLSAEGSGELPLVSVTSRAGHQITFGHSPDGVPLSVTHDGGYQITMNASAGRITALTLAGTGSRGRDAVLARYGYDESGNLAEVINSSGQALRFSYDPDGRLTGWKDRNGWWYRYRYDRAGRCVRGDGPDGLLSGTFGYDTENRVTTCTDAAGAVTVYELTAERRVAAETDPLGSTTRSQYDQHGQLVSQTDPLGRITRWTYDQAGNLVTLIRPDGSQATARHNDLGLPVVITEPGGAAWQQEFDTRDSLILVTAPDGAVTRYTYDQRGNLATVTDPMGAVTTVECNAAGLPVAVTVPDGRIARYERDGSGRITAVTGLDGLVTRLRWTAGGQLASRAFADGSSELFSYDAEGNLLTYLDPAGAMTRFGYGYLDRLTAHTGPDGTRTEFGYDHALRLTSVVHAGLAWRYTYDPAGRLTAQTDYNGAVTSYYRDASGQLTGRVNAAGQQVSYVYDVLGNMTERHAGGSVTTFGYDAAGRLARAAGPDAAIVLERDAAGRVTAESCNGRSVRSGYDAAGRRVWRVTPSDTQTRWDYDLAGRPVALTAAGHEFRFGYDTAGRETLRELPGGVTLAQEWDTAGRLAAQVLTARPDLPVPIQPQPVAARMPGAGTSRLLQRRGYSYQAAGLVAGIDDLLSGPRRLALDAAGQVTGVTGPGWSESYGYDPAGNITAAVWPAPAPPGGTGLAGTQGPREYSGTLITRSGDVRYENDRAGRIVLRQHARLSRKPDTWRYEWDADDHLTAVTTPDASRWQYKYDPFGRRIAKQRLSPDGEVTEHTSFTWDGPVLTEQATFGSQGPGSGRLLTWDYQPETFVPLTQAERWQRAQQDRVDERFYAIVTDLIGTPAELVSFAGDLAGHQRQTLWGTVYWSGASTPLRFPGQYHDDETGLHYNNHRYYDPATGRYLTPDPLGLAPAPNPHAYVPNPTVLTDPLGLAPYTDPPAEGGSGVKGRGDMYVAHENGPYGLIAELDKDGMLNMYVKAGPGTPRGGDMFSEAMRVFGSNVEGVRGTWLGGGDLTSNYDSYRAAVLAGSTPAEAAMGTFTGKMASRFGFTNVKVVSDTIGKVVAEFTR